MDQKAPLVYNSGNWIRNFINSIKGMGVLMDNRGSIGSKSFYKMGMSLSAVSLTFGLIPNSRTRQKH